MKNIYLKTEDNIMVLSVGAGMFLWLAISSFVYPLLFTVCKYLLISVGINAIFNYCLNELLCSIVFLFITWKIFNWIRRESLDSTTARKVLGVAIISFISCQILQFIISYYLLQLIAETYFTRINTYNQETTALSNIVNLRLVSHCLEIFRYVLLALLIYKKITAVNSNKN